MTEKCPSPNDQTNLRNPGSSGHGHLPPALLLAGVFVVMASVSWGTWLDPIIDFGRELYVPWQLSQGKVLYRDIVSYFNGPLSPYVHALLFILFGVSLRTLVMFNLLVVASLTTLLYRLLAPWAGRLAATVAGVVFLVLFAFAQFLISGNYNFVTPYSYELSHGITLSAAAIACMIRWHKSNRRAWLIASGVLLGLIFLTKAEVFLAAAGALSVGFFGNLFLKRDLGEKTATDATIFLGCAFAPILVAFCVMCAALSPAQASRALMGAWAWVGNERLLNLPFFKNLAGTDNLPRSLWMMVHWSGAYLVLLGIPVVLARIVKSGKARAILAGWIFAIYLFVGLSFWLSIPWLDFARAWPVMLGVVGIVLVIRLVKYRTDVVAPLMLISWAGLLLLKILFFVRISHYGFVLAMPATLVITAIFLGQTPIFLDRSPRCGWPLRAGVLAMLVVALYAHADQLAFYWKTKSFVVGAAGDAFLADVPGEFVNEITTQFAPLAPPGATLAVIPEGLMINYLTRRENPTGQLNFTPPAMIMYGDAEMLAAFQSHPPDFLMLMNTDSTEYGARTFGIDYAQTLYRWILDNYEEAKQIGAKPGGKGLGVTIMKKKS
jgi:hypothetical protein